MSSDVQPLTPEAIKAQTKRVVEHLKVHLPWTLKLHDGAFVTVCPELLEKLDAQHAEIGRLRKEVLAAGEAALARFDKQDHPNRRFGAFVVFKAMRDALGDK